MSQVWCFCENEALSYELNSMQLELQRQFFVQGGTCSGSTAKVVASRIRGREQ